MLKSPAIFYCINVFSGEKIGLGSLKKARYRRKTRVTFRMFSQWYCSGIFKLTFIIAVKASVFNRPTREWKREYHICDNLIFLAREKFWIRVKSNEPGYTKGVDRNIKCKFFCFHNNQLKYCKYRPGLIHTHSPIIPLFSPYVTALKTFTRLYTEF